MKTTLIALLLLLSMGVKSQRYMYVDSIKLVNNTNKKELKFDSFLQRFHEWSGDCNYKKINLNTIPDYNRNGYKIVTTNGINNIEVLYGYWKPEKLDGFCIPAYKGYANCGTGQNELKNKITFVYADEVKIKLLMTFEQVIRQFEQEGIKFYEKSEIAGIRDISIPDSGPICWPTNHTKFRFVKGLLMQIMYLNGDVP